MLYPIRNAHYPAPTADLRRQVVWATGPSTDCNQAGLALYELVAAGGGGVEDPATSSEILLLRHNVQLAGVQQPVPTKAATGVGGNACADSRKRALGDALALVERVAAAKALDKVDMLLLHSFNIFALVLPRIFAGDTAAAVAGALGADDFLIAASGAGTMPAETQAAGAVGVLELCKDMVPDVPVIFLPICIAAVVVLAADLLSRSNLTFVVAAPGTATHGHEVLRRAVETPVHHVDIVDVLLADLVA